MDYLYAPWRSEYFNSKKDTCVFCAISKGVNLHTNTKEDFLLSDTSNHVFYRDSKIFCVMNKFPYTPGHFLIIPHTHTHSPELLDLETWLRLQTFAQKGVALLKEFGASGINMGMNIERAGGAGIPEHLHLHLVPRYIGDTNFLTTIGDARAYGVNFDMIFKRIKALSEVYFAS
ncbi:HIT family protein [Helicobacter turcicus]|uniref:HIT domain-containing protein n=1 Tax=Helicobacter turcicus TaxID=2867412 RepID=A0ABS7JMN4_9HELI|nr:HIT domain-containing protein [Helicobacter turcicus]MBX7490640.1 HIT domain-containing protein [Helicobacter turcicus]MBX7545452.1 HIT domain-containing protein [Helicobacter turcicus]